MGDRSPGAGERREARGAWAATENCPSHNYGNHDYHQDESSNENSAGLHIRSLNGNATYWARVAHGVPLDPDARPVGRSFFGHWNRSRMLGTFRPLLGVVPVFLLVAEIEQSKCWDHDQSNDQHCPVTLTYQQEDSCGNDGD
jgi:hypothetical protein